MRTRRGSTAPASRAGTPGGRSSRSLRDGLREGERILHLTSGTYRLQMGFLAITDRHVVFGMSWAFLPFIRRRRDPPRVDLVGSRRLEAVGRATGPRLARGRGILGNLEEADAERLAGLIYALSTRRGARRGCHRRHPGPDRPPTRAELAGVDASQAPAAARLGGPRR